MLNVKKSNPVILDTATTASAVKTEVTRPQAATPKDSAMFFILLFPIPGT